MESRNASDSTSPPLESDDVSLEPASEAELEEIEQTFVDQMGVAKGDLDAIIERRVLRVATSFSRTGFFLDGGQPRGATYEAARLFVRDLNAGRSALHSVALVFVPVARDRLLQTLLDGRADIASANLTISAGRAKLVDFSTPFANDVREVVVAGPAAPLLDRLDDLAGKDVYVRKSSSYFESLEELSEKLELRGLSPISIVPVSEFLEDEDILELVANGVFPLTVIDEHLARLWTDIIENLSVRDDLVVASDRDIAWAMRPQSPQLKRAIDQFIRKHRKGTLLGNILINRYYRDNQWARNPLSAEDQRRFDEVADIFRAYATRYNVDWLLAMAQGYQESRLDQSARSSAGAVGIMQIKPSTAADPNVGVPDVERLEENIHAGIKYLNFLRERYFSHPDIAPIDRIFFSLAAYNAGPRRVSMYRRNAAERGLDPDIWLHNVEEVSNRETIQYVRNIIKYFASYAEHQRLVVAAKDEAKAAAGQDRAGARTDRLR